MPCFAVLLQTDSIAGFMWTEESKNSCGFFGNELCMDGVFWNVTSIGERQFHCALHILFNHILNKVCF